MKSTDLAPHGNLITDVLASLQATGLHTLFGQNLEMNADPPSREWAGKRGNNPVLNLYLYDIRENRDLRESDWAVRPDANGNPYALRRSQPPKRIDLSYMVTAWAQEVEDEHTILWHALRVFLANPVLKRELLEGDLRAAVDETDIDVRLTAAQPEGVLKQTTDFWTSIENHLKPSINLVVTIPMVSDISIEVGPPVRTRTLKTHRVALPTAVGRSQSARVRPAARSSHVDAFAYRQEPAEEVTWTPPEPVTKTTKESSVAGKRGPGTRKGA